VGIVALIFANADFAGVSGLPGYRRLASAAHLFFLKRNIGHSAARPHPVTPAMLSA